MAYNLASILRNILLLVLPFLLLGCFEGEEGCLDAKALDYDVTADTDCTGCCTYPSLQLNFTHKVYLEKDTANLEYQVAYPNDLGSFFVLENIRYYLSEVKLLDGDGGLVEVEDLIDIPFLEGADTTFIETIDNFILVDPDVFQTQNIGTLIYNGEINALQFRVGIPEFIQGSSPDLFDEDHPLAVQDPVMYDSLQNRYLYNRIALRADTLPETTSEVIQITDNDQLISVTLPLGVTVPNGFNMLVSLEVDYLSWFADVDFQNDDQQTIKDKIVANMSNSFRVLSVTFSL